MSIRTLFFGLLAGLFCAGDAASVAVTPPATVDTADELPTPRREPVPSSPPATERPAAAPGNQVLRGNPLWAIPLRQLSATRERPLFAPSRRRPPPAVANTFTAPPKLASAPTPPAKPQLSLLGTIAAGADSIGMFIDQADKTVLRLKLGENHKGWVLREVNRGDVTLQKKSRSETIALPARNLKVQPAAPQTTGSLPPQVDPPDGAKPESPPALGTAAAAFGIGEAQATRRGLKPPPPPPGAPAPINIRKRDKSNI